MKNQETLTERIARQRAQRNAGKAIKTTEADWQALRDAAHAIRNARPVTTTPYRKPRGMVFRPASETEEN